MIDLSRATRKEKDDALKESQVLSSLKHPNIVKYRDNFLAEGWLCIVMDYCEGGDLSARIKKARSTGKTFSEEQVLWWFAQGLQAVKYIHDLHIIHRDLKSGNFFLSKSGNLKMGDFGIAKVLECTAACAQTQVGTPYYLCPEICKGKPYSWGSDIWAMGCILYEMCALRVPFDGHDLKSLIQRITKAPMPELPAAYSKGLQSVLNKLLNRNPDSRPQAEDILEIPLVRDMVKKMHKDEPRGDRSERRGSEAESEAAKPESVAVSVASSGAYSDSAGTYAKRDKVEYHSATHAEWLPATITDVDATGRILMDVKPNTWISIEVQAEKVRPRKGAPEAKGAKRPSPAPSAPRSASSRPMSARDAPHQDKQQPMSARRRNSVDRPAVPRGPELGQRRQSAPALGRRPSSSDAAAGPKYGDRRSPRVGPAVLGA
jgi:NIMA (never in mitosis gene a)-related kinase